MGSSVLSDDFNFFYSLWDTAQRPTCQHSKVLTTKCSGCCSAVVVSPVASQQKGPRFEYTLTECLSKFACSPCVCMGFLQLFSPSKDMPLTVG